MDLRWTNYRQRISLLWTETRWSLLELPGLHAFRSTLKTDDLEEQA